MTPASAIGMLDRALLRDGEYIVLRRIVGTENAAVNNDVVCRAFVTALTEQQLVAGITATEINVVISPTQINNRQWPGGTAPQTIGGVDKRVPVVGLDRVIITARGGAPKTVTFVDPVYRNATLVRINMRAG